MLALFFLFLPSSLPTDDHSRVVLSHLDGHLCSDYINASYIDVNLEYKSALDAFDAYNRAFGKLLLTPLFCFVFPHRVLKRNVNLLLLKVNTYSGFLF